ncbi:hypothetical protein N7533_005681 [Penicillium manginii]|uniref:uncharacterized protein n=1 Tax=Penicillium manginii TaxID=203109 RepID=UPI0025496CE8|nr:uncharacterized protein N7533_005681 [Penicillium manginii]KAJ5756138.1 hypothetical protein N7533_005681 [Penicillium manginii]
MSKGKKPKNKPRPPPAPGSRHETPQHEELDLANLPPLPSSPATTTRPEGNRKAGQDPVGDATGQAGELADGLTSGLQIPGKTQGGDEKDGSLRIKIHLNLHAKVRLDLDAQIYGDIVIGLL